jgi:hypothetical protein
MKQIISENRIQALKEKVSFYGFDLVELSDRFPYNQRTTRTFGLIDRRLDCLVCAYGFEVLTRKIQNKELIF